VAEKIIHNYLSDASPLTVNVITDFSRQVVL